MNDNDSNNNDKSASNVNVNVNTTGSSSSSDSGRSGDSDGFNYMNSWRQQITGMMDDQRLHRLQQCRILQTVLSDCRKSNRKSNSNNSNSPAVSSTDNDASNTTRQRRLELEDVPAGIRMVRYFNWRDYEVPSGASDIDDTGSTNNIGNNNNNNGNHCLREEHAVWACRSVALSCGAPLAQLKSCFAEAGADAVLDPSNQTAYEPSAPQTAKTPCQWQQQALGDCVAAAAVQLHERQESSKASTDTSTSTNTPGC